MSEEITKDKIYQMPILAIAQTKKDLINLVLSIMIVGIANDKDYDLRLLWDTAKDLNKDMMSESDFNFMRDEIVKELTKKLQGMNAEVLKRKMETRKKGDKQ